MRYVLHPGYVTSKNDGDEHWISAGNLARLYRVKPTDCIVVDGRTRGHVSLPDDVHLYPRYDGDYKLP